MYPKCIFCIGSIGSSIDIQIDFLKYRRYIWDTLVLLATFKYKSGTYCIASKCI